MSNKHVKSLICKLASAGDLDALKEVVKRDEEMGEHSFTCAAANGQIHVMDYLYSIGIMPCIRAQACAAMGGHLNVLEWLNQRRRLVKEGSISNGCQAAASNGHLDCLKFLHENGAKWGKGTTQAAARHGHLDCLKYAHENGCPWDYLVYYMAKSNGHTEIVQYLEENGCPQEEPQQKYACSSYEWNLYSRPIFVHFTAPKE